MDPRLLAVFLAHLAPKVGMYLAIAAAILGGIVLVVDLVAY